MIEVDPMDYSKFCIYHVDHPYDTIYRFMAIFRQTEKMTHLPFIIYCWWRSKSSLFVKQPEFVVFGLLSILLF
jgi:hypothetical protein